MADEPYAPSQIGNPSVLARRNWWQTKLVIFIGKHTPKCRDMVQILSQSMDRPLPLTMRVKKRIHYLICCWCQRYEEHLYFIRKTASSFAEHANKASTAPVPIEAKERWKQALRAEPRGAQLWTQKKAPEYATGAPAIPRRNWSMTALVAVAAVLLVFFFTWEKRSRPAVSLADYRDEMVSFVKVEPSLEMKSTHLSELMDWLEESHAPAGFFIPEKIQDMEPVGCRVLRFHDHDVTLICFHRANGRLLHLFVMDHLALPQLPARQRAELSLHGEWMTAAWAEGEHVYLLAVQGDQTLLERLLTNA